MAGVRWRGGVKRELVVENDCVRFFLSLYLPNVHIKGHNYYRFNVICSLLVAFTDTEIDDIE